MGDDRLEDLFAIYPWFLEHSDTPGNVRMSEFGAEVAKFWVMEAPCPTTRMALAVDAISHVPALAAIAAEAYGIHIGDEDATAEEIRWRIVKTFLVRIRKNRIAQ